MTDSESGSLFTPDQQREQVSASGQSTHQNLLYPITNSPLAMDQFEFDIPVLQPQIQPMHDLRYAAAPENRGIVHPGPMGEPQWIMQKYAATGHSSTPPVSDSSTGGGLSGLGQPSQQVRDSFTASVRNQSARQMAPMPPAYRKPGISGPVPSQHHHQRNNNSIQGTQQSGLRRESVPVSSYQPLSAPQQNSGTTPAARGPQRPDNGLPGLKRMQVALAQGIAFGTPALHSSGKNTPKSETQPTSTQRRDNVAGPQNKCSQQNEYTRAVLLAQYQRNAAGPLDLLAAENHHAIPGPIPSPRDLENALANWARTIHVLDQRGKSLKQRLLRISLPNHREIDRKMVNTGLEALRPFIEGEKRKTARWRDVLGIMKSRMGIAERREWVEAQLKEAEKHFDGRMSQLEDIQSALRVSAHCVLRLEQMQEDYKAFGRYRGVAGR